MAFNFHIQVWLLVLMIITFSLTQINPAKVARVGLGNLLEDCSSKGSNASKKY